MKNKTEKRDIKLDQIHGFLISYIFIHSARVLVSVYFAYNLFSVLYLISNDSVISFKTRLKSARCFDICLILLITENIALFKEFSSTAAKLAATMITVELLIISENGV